MTTGQTRGSRSSTLVSSRYGAPAPAAPWRASHLEGRADQQPQHVGLPLQLPRARADTDLLDRHRRLGAPVVGEGAQQGGPGRGAQLDRHRPAVRREAAEQLDDGGRRHRQPAVRRADRAGAERDRRGDDPGQPEVDDAGADADHVGDGVQGAHLVEVHVGGVDAVHPPLGLGQPLEDVVGQRAHVLVQPGLAEQPLDVAPGPFVGGVGDLDVAAHRGQGRRASPARWPASPRRAPPCRRPRRAPRSGRRRRAAPRGTCRRWRRTRRPPRRASTAQSW